MRSYYAREMGEMKISKKSGSGTDEVYKSKWAYFDTLASFLRAKTGYLGIEIMCARGVTYLPADCCFSHVARYKPSLVRWSSTKRIALSSHRI